MCVVSKIVDVIFDSLVTELPQGWIAKFDNLSRSIQIFGPDEAMIFIKATLKNQTTVIGRWPENHNGKKMDPYEWGVLSFNEDYPFTRLTILKSPRNNINDLLNYIKDYNKIYNKCLSKYSLQILA